MKNQKIFLKFFLMGILILSVIACSKDDDVVVTPDTDTDSDTITTENLSYSKIELDILKLVNEHRATIDKSPLTMHMYIYEQATIHTNNMISENDINHDGFSERSKAIRDSIGGNGTAENVAYGYSSAEAVVNGWLNSSGHKKNIEGDYTLTGISAIKNDNGTYYYTQIFLNKK